MNSTWTTLYEVYSRMSHFKRWIILVETTWRIYDVPKINSWSLWSKQLFQVTERSKKDQTEMSGLTTIHHERISWRSTNLLCDKAVEITNAESYVFRTLSGRYQWPTSRSLENQQFNDIWKHVIKKDFESNRWRGRWSSSGNFPRIHYIVDFSRFNSWWLNYSVNLSISNVGSSSCHRTRTLYGENKETHNNKIMLADSCWNVGHLWTLDQRRNGTQLVLMNQTEIWTNLLKECCSTPAENGHPTYFATNALERVEIRSKNKVINLFTSTVEKKPLKAFFERLFL